MGLSGWLVFILLLLENRVAMPLPGGNTTLDWVLILTILVWLLAKLEMIFVSWWHSPSRHE
jgi:hypothetical protein